MHIVWDIYNTGLHDVQIFCYILIYIFSVVILTYILFCHCE